MHAEIFREILHWMFQKGSAKNFAILCANRGIFIENPEIPLVLQTNVLAVHSIEFNKTGLFEINNWSSQIWTPAGTVKIYASQIYKIENLKMEYYNVPCREYDGLDKYGCLFVNVDLGTFVVFGRGAYIKYRKRGRKYFKRCTDCPRERAKEVIKFLESKLKL